MTIRNERWESEQRLIEGGASGVQVAEGKSSSTGMRPPTSKYQWKPAKEQPEATGYFTITNWT